MRCPARKAPAPRQDSRRTLARWHGTRRLRQAGLSTGGRSPRPPCHRLCRTDARRVPPPAATMGPAGSALAGGHSQIVLWGSVVAVATCLLVAFLVLLCSSCDR